MNIKVVYHSSTGNTKKLALAIADALHVPAETASDSTMHAGEPIDLLLLGDGIYAGKPSKAVIAFVGQLTPQAVKNAAIFATYGGQKKIGAELQALLESKGVRVIAEPYLCRGKAWVIANRSHPNEAEIQGARAFAEAAVAQLKENA